MQNQSNFKPVRFGEWFSEEELTKKTKKEGTKTCWKLIGYLIIFLTFLYRFKLFFVLTLGPTYFTVQTKKRLFFFRKPVDNRFVFVNDLRLYSLGGTAIPADFISKYKFT